MEKSVKDVQTSARCIGCPATGASRPDDQPENPRFVQNLEVLPVDVQHVDVEVDVPALY